eukprot:TRINITY_DN8056_c0_g4_i1.p2 TRINITY_DN8056_c0_g4~~TRINITY_DN8056_c0_g4_i1.p2  ORF type:complete len:101 (-),score=24.30 TRINITY_DN8056_c0_g4_i1:850-1152(-)
MDRSLMKMKKPLQSKWNRRLDCLHMNHLTNMKPLVDATNPLHFGHIHSKCKKEQLIEGIFAFFSRVLHGDREGKQDAAGEIDKDYGREKRIEFGVFEELL